VSGVQFSSVDHFSSQHQFTVLNMIETSAPKFTILWGHVEEILLLNKFFSYCQYVP